MRNFLLKFLEASQVDDIEKMFKTKNPESSGLPTYISKTRLDEEISKRKTAEQEVETTKNALKAFPADWEQQLKDAKAALETQKNSYEEKLGKANKEADIAAQIYGSGARNMKAVRALLDDTKPIEEQLKALTESDPYLFSKSGGRGGLPKGTGKGDGTHGGEGDEAGEDAGKLSVEAMYKAVGLTPPQN